MATYDNLLNPIIKKRLELLMHNRGVKDCKITIARAPIENASLLGGIWELKISGKGAGKEVIAYNWILKTATLTEVVRKYAQIDRMFKKEIFVYEKIIPVFESLIKENNISEPFAVTPKLHTYFMETFMESLVMDNMKYFDFAAVRTSEPTSYGHISLAMKAFGKLHALSYAMREHKPEDFKRFAEYAKNRFNVNVNVELYAKHQRICCNRVLEALKNNRDRSLVPLFKKFMEKSFEYQMQAIKMSSLGAYAVLTHGDAIMDNMLFKYGDSNRPNIPTELCLLDWQFCRYGSPALDLSQFIFLTTDKQFREKYYKEMIRTYYYSLCSYLAELRCDAEQILPFEVLQLQLKRYSVYGLCMAIMILHIVMSDRTKGEAWRNDGDIDAAFESFDGNIDTYRTRIRDVVSDFKEYGYFEFLN